MAGFFRKEGALHYSSEIPFDPVAFFLSPQFAVFFRFFFDSQRKRV